MIDRIRAYYTLVKPGVLYGNVLTAVAGFMFASAGGVDFGLLILMTFGTTLVVASACVLNNYLDRDIDKVMVRTRGRPSVTGLVSGRAMLVYSATLLALGLFILVAAVNILTAVVGVVGFVTYVWLYGALSKRRSIHGTLVGSVSGALPIVGGYTAATNQLDFVALALFLIIFFWQFVEFFSIAIYRRKEYAAAKVPVLPVVKGVSVAKRQIFGYAVAYVLLSLVPVLVGWVGLTYGVVVGVMGCYTLWLAWRGLSASQSELWARQMFKHSMWSILILCLMLSIGHWLP